MPRTDPTQFIRKGDLVVCPGCGQKHPAEPADDGNDLMLFVSCGEKTYIVAFNHHPFVSEKENTDDQETD